MNKLYIFFLFLILSNCSFKPVVKHHGVPSLEKKQKSLIINKTNKNDIVKILGSPSTTSKFDNDVWIYIERKQTQSKLKNLGRMKIFKNDVLVLEIDDYGILNKKDTASKVGKQLGGLVTLYAMLQMRAELGDENTGAFEFNSPQYGPLKGTGYSSCL